MNEIFSFIYQNTLATSCIFQTTIFQIFTPPTKLILGFDARGATLNNTFAFHRPSLKIYIGHIVTKILIVLVNYLLARVVTVQLLL